MPSAPELAKFVETTTLIKPRPEEGSKDRTMVLNMGPQHPSTHGVLRVLLELDGETVVRAVPDLGYLHTGIEKSCEDKTYSQAITLTDRMGYLNPLEIHGYARFAQEAVAAGVDGVLVVDCPLEEAEALTALRAAGLQQILLAAPTTAPARMAQLCEAARGFLYYVSFAGITGAGRLSTQDIAARVADIRARAKAPVAVGFGVKDAQSAKAIAGFADAVVIGSALVERLEGAKSAQEIAARAGEFLRPIRAALEA